MPKWEYLNLVATIGDKKVNYVWVNNKVVLSNVSHADFYNYLNTLGKDGWEMVAYSLSSSNQYANSFYFKRSLSN